MYGQQRNFSMAKVLQYTLVRGEVVDCYTGGVVDC